MKRVLPVLMALILLNSATAAQTTVAATESTSTVELTSEQRTVIKRYASERYLQPVRLKGLIPAGSTVPDDVEFDLLPGAIIRQNPRLKGYSYFLSETGTYIVDPGSRRVITSID